MKLYFYIALLFANYGFFGIIFIGQSLLYSLMVEFHWPHGPLVKIIGILIDAFLLFAIFRKRSNPAFKIYGVVKAIIGLAIVGFVFEDKDLNCRQILAFTAFGILSLAIAAINLSTTPKKLLV